MFCNAMRIVSISVWLCLIAGSTAKASKTWTGSASDVWSNPQNWTNTGLPPNIPANGDDIRFDFGGNGRLNSNVDYDLSISTLTFAESSPIPTGSFTIGGSTPLTIRNAIFSYTASPQRFDIPLNGTSSGMSIFNNEPAGGKLTFAGPLSIPNYVDFIMGTAGVDILNVISGSGGLTKGGAGTLTLSAANTYTGSTQLNSASTTRLVDEGTLGDASALQMTTGSRLEMLGVPQTVRSLSGNGIITGAALTVGRPGIFDGAVDFDGILSNASLTKTGTGTLTLDGANTYTGPTIVEEGILSVHGTQRLHEYTDVTVAPAGRFTISGTNSINTLSGSGRVSFIFSSPTSLTILDRFNAGSTFSGVIDGSGTLVKRGNSELVLTGVNDFRSASIEAGTLRITGGGRLGSVTDVSISSGATLAMDGMVDQIGGLTGAGTVSLSGNANLILGSATFGGNIVGSGGITFKGGGLGTLTSANNTYTGNTAVEAGTLDVNQIAIAPDSPVIVGGQATSVYSLSGPAGIYSLPSLTIQDSGTVRFAIGSKKLLLTPSLTITGTGKLDMGTNDMIVTAGEFQYIRDLIAHARIIPSNNGSRPIALGILLNDNGFGQPLYPSFHGASNLAATDIIVASTLPGDLNLDGSVTIADFIDLAAHFNQSGTWHDGDINYDGKVTIADFISLASQFNKTYAGDASPISPGDRQLLSAFTASIGADPAVIGLPVPEPATLPLAIIALILARKKQKAA